MSASFSVAALISAGRHPVSGAPRSCRGDAVAMALGRSLVGDALRVVHAGAEQEPSLQDYLALGAKNIEVLPINPNGDVVAVLAAYLKDVDIILTGVGAELGAGSGLLPYALAQTLERPIVSNVLDAKVANSGASSADVEIRQFLPKGQRRRLACSLPLVIAVHPLSPGRTQIRICPPFVGSHRSYFAIAGDCAGGTSELDGRESATPARAAQSAGQEIGPCPFAIGNRLGNEGRRCRF